MSKLALKRLTGSDLTLFEWQFGGSGQKSITLNADIFVDHLFPRITEAARGKRWIPLDLWIFGPGNRARINLQRKVMNSVASKNWLLGGEIIRNPLKDPDRFNPLLPDDYVILSFEGDIIPFEATAVFVAQSVPEDARLHSALEGLGRSGRDTMWVLDEKLVTEIAARAGLADDHPLVSFALTDELQEAALGDAGATERLLRRGRAPNISIEVLTRAREQADEMGRLGEELVAIYLERQMQLGIIGSFEWVSETNAVAPMDFRVSPIAGPTERLDAKTTNGPFDRPIHISLAELREMAAEIDGPYRIYRVYSVGEEGAKLRVSENLKQFAQGVFACLVSLPSGIVVDAVSVDPSGIQFGSEIVLPVAEESEE